MSDNTSDNVPVENPDKIPEIAQVFVSVRDYGGSCNVQSEMSGALKDIVFCITRIRAKLDAMEKSLFEGKITSVE